MINSKKKKFILILSGAFLFIYISFTIFLSLKPLGPLFANEGNEYWLQAEVIPTIAKREIESKEEKQVGIYISELQIGNLVWFHRQQPSVNDLINMLGNKGTRENFFILEALRRIENSPEKEKVNIVYGFFKDKERSNTNRLIAGGLIAKWGDSLILEEIRNFETVDKNEKLMQQVIINYIESELL